MLAAERCGRSSIGFENDPTCEEMIRRRIEFEIMPLIEQSPLYEVVRI